jgi:hypothetical protein
MRIVTAFSPLYNAKLIAPKEFIRLIYRSLALHLQCLMVHAYLLR